MSGTQNQHQQDQQEYLQQQQDHHHQQQEEHNQQLNLHHQNIISTITPINPHTTLLDMQQYQATTSSDPFGTSSRAGLVFPGLTPPQQQPHLLPWNLPHQLHHHHHHNHHDPFLFPSSSTSYANFFTRRPASSLQFAYDGLLSDALGPMVQPGSAPFGLQHELNKMTAQEIMDAKALAASKSHSEAERRRRERINNHLAKLRSLLPNTTKTDKASLLAEVIQHVKELRRQTSIIAETSPIPTEADELTVDPAMDGQDGKFIIKTTLCCEDRSDLLPDIIKALKSLRLRTLKAEISTLGGRVKNVLFVTQEPPSGEDQDQDHDHHQQQPCSIASIQEALKAVMEKSSSGDESNSGNPKRQRTNSINIS